MKPLKRHPTLVPLSQEHHHTLALCTRILRTPNANHQTDITAHFIDLEKHFLKEETFICTALGQTARCHIAPTF